MSILKRVYGILLVVALFGWMSIAVQAQDEKDINPSDVVHCETLDDITKAKESGVLFLEFRNNFWVKVGEDYKGPFRYLRSAQKILNQYKLDMMKKPAPEKPVPPSTVSPSAPPAAQKTTTYYNPQMILFPFIELMPDQKVQFSIPGGLTVAASHVMIHPEPLEFEDISFGLIDLNQFMQNPPIDPTQLGNIPKQASQKPMERYFAVTGKITARETVTMPTAPLNYWVGAAVIGKDGSLLWREYGDVENYRSFKCVGRIPETTSQPEFLLLFTLAKGPLAQNIRPKPEFPSLDATPYDYHVLGSSILEVDTNWNPPLQEATKKEYEELMKSMHEKQIDSLRSKNEGKNTTP